MVERIIARGYPFGSWITWPRKIVHRRVANPHLYALAGSGSGKSRLLYWLCVQDIDYALANPEKQGVVVVDPHGDLYRNILNYIALVNETTPVEDRIVLIEPVNQQRGSVGVNVLEVPEGVVPYEITDEVIASAKAIWTDSWGHRMEDILRHTCLCLQEHGLTIAQAPRFLTDENFRNALVESSRDRDTKLYWQGHFASFKKNDQVLFVESTRNKISAFVSNPYLKPILCQRISTVNFFELMNSGKIILINLSRSHLKSESRRLFGMLLFARIHQALISRDEIPENQRTPVSIYVDEMHEIFHPEYFLNLLEGGRKYRAALNLFHQSTSQLFPDQVNIALNNCATLVCGNVGRRDAEIMSKEIFHFSGERVKHQDGDIFSGKIGKPTFYSVQEEMENAIKELMKQNIGEFYIKLKGQRTQPFVANSIRVDYPPINTELEEKLREASAKHYNRPLDRIYQEMENMEAEAMAKAAHRAAEPTSFRE